MVRWIKISLFLFSFGSSFEPADSKQISYS
jgi:hypothetical protein